MKKIVCVILLMMAAIAARAEFGEIDLGGFFTCGLKDKMPGMCLSVKSQHYHSGIRTVLSLEHYFEKNDKSCSALTWEDDYLFEVGERLRLYPSTGLSIVTWTPEGQPFRLISDKNEYKVAINFGAGVECLLNEHWLIGIDGKYRHMHDASQFILSAGLAYRF